MYLLWMPKVRGFLRTGNRPKLGLRRYPNLNLINLSLWHLPRYIIRIITFRLHTYYLY